MNYQWDKGKAVSNRRKHGVRFADAVTVFSDERALTMEDDFPDEVRFVTLGMDSSGRILLVVFTYRGEAIRIISARKATPLEQQQYFTEQ
jgi:uncharacterized DUF497 family protein